MSEINVYLKNNEAKECCFFTYNYLEHKIDENLISKGCYKFSVGKNNNPNLSYETIPFLTLTYKTDEDGKLTNENITASGYKLNLIGSSSATYSIISKYLAYIIHSGFISGYQNRYGDNLKPPTNVYHRMTA